MPQASSSSPSTRNNALQSNGRTDARRKSAPGTTAAQIKEATRRSALWGRPGFLIRRLHQIHTSLFIEETKAFDLTPVQYSLMTALAEHGVIDQMTLALEIGLERTSVAEVIPRLEAKGLLRRSPSAQDGRAKLVRLTAKGRRLVARMESAVQRAHDRTLAHLPKAERDVFLLNLIKLVERSNEHGSVPLRLR
jgi:DNA-binding MarR family transcriptional regulator